MMTTRLILKCILLFSVYYTCKAESDADKLWILFDHTNLFECAGVTNRYIINKDDISITDKNGKLAYYLECPNDYLINFNNIKVTQTLENMSGQFSALLQVPLVSLGNTGLSLDFPYQVIPLKKLLEGSQCDNESGVFSDTGAKKEYCRYCEVCESTSHAEQKISSDSLGHKYVDIDSSNSFNKVCKRINAQAYSISRQVSVPGKKELEDSANANVKGNLDKTAEQKLKIGKGKLVISMQLMSSNTAPVSANAWYAKQRGCECCRKDSAGNSNCKQSGFSSILSNIGGGILGSGNACLKCNNQYVQTCLQGQTQVVGCYTVEYNFRVTDKRADVDEFQKQIDYNKNANKAKYTDSDKNLNTKVNVLNSGSIASSGTSNNLGSVSSSASGSGSSSSSGQLSVNTDTGKSSGSAVASSGTSSKTSGSACNQCTKAACIAAITFTPTKGYCSSWWDTASAKGYCCNKCPTVCPAGCC